MKSSYTDSLAHTTFECKYHIVFAPKFRRKEIYGTLRREIGMILRELCKRKDLEVIIVKFSNKLQDKIVNVTKIFLIGYN